MKLNTETVEAIIEEVNSLDLNTVSIDKVIDLIDQVYEGRRTIAYTFKERYPLYRAICYDEDPKSAADMSYNPWLDKIKEFGRCNYPGEAVFYCCTTLPGALGEIGKSWKTVYVGLWSIQKAQTMNNVGFTERVCQDLGNKGDFSHRINSVVGREGFDETNQRIYEFMSEIFSRKIAREESFKYKLSACIFHSMIRGEPPGLLYPSIANDGKYDNLAFRTEIIDQKLIKLVQVNRFAKLYIPGQGSMEGYYEENLKFLTGSARPDVAGNLNWLDSPIPFSDLMDSEGYVSF